MIIDTRSLTRDKPIEADVCIVGAGTAGITLAKEFVDQHFNVCLIESGGLKPDRETQALYEGKNVGRPYYRLDTSRARYFGGSTNRWHIAFGDDCSRARMRPFEKIDFEYRDWVPFSGWPFTKAHLDPYYDRAQAFCQIAPSSYHVKDWSDPQKTPPIRLGGKRTQTVIFKFGSRYPFIKEYADEINQAANISTYLHANVIEIEMAETARTVERMQVACLDGNTHWVSAKVFILAAGAIEIPRLLLASRKTCSDGVGNQNDLVGRFFMEHLHFSLGFYLPSNPEAFKAMGLYSKIHEISGVPIRGKISPTEDVLRSERLLNHVVEFVPKVSLATIFDRFFYPRIDSTGVQSFMALLSAIRSKRLPDPLLEHLLNAATGLDDIAVSTYRNLKKRLRRLVIKKRVHYFVLENMSEQAPNYNSRVVLGQDRDRNGLSRANLDWQLTTIDLNSAKRCLSILDEELRRDGLGQLLLELDDDTPPERIIGGWHHMGTTRMHTDPKQGVVDQNCRVHGIDNLFIAGPSVFPTGGYANPSLTIVALALRLADHIKNDFDKITA
jgi:choline dehydrogenase-like flavoprotein